MSPRLSFLRRSLRPRKPAVKAKVHGNFNKLKKCLFSNFYTTISIVFQNKILIFMQQIKGAQVQP